MVGRSSEMLELFFHWRHITYWNRNTPYNQFRILWYSSNKILASTGNSLLKDNILNGHFNVILHKTINLLISYAEQEMFTLPKHVILRYRLELGLCASSSVCLCPCIGGFVIVIMSLWYQCKQGNDAERFHWLVIVIRWKDIWCSKSYTLKRHCLRIG